MVLHAFHLLLILILPFLGIGTQTASAEPPNILVFVADDVNWDDFGCYGNEAIRTPNIDSLAAGGLLCKNAFLTTPQCSPTRISVLTGKYAHTVRAEDLHTPLPAGQKMVPAYLCEAGYFTGHMRKTHYGPEGEKQFDWYSKDFEFDRFLDEAGEKPFFLWVGFRDAHRPYEPGAVDPPHDPAKVKVPPYLVDDQATREDLALYYDEIARMDENIGRFLAELKTRNELENTLIVYFNDNGRPFPRAKGSLYDSGIKTALLFQWPAKLKAGSVHKGLSSLIDLAPTLLEAAGVPIPEEMQGTSMLPRLLDPDLPGRDSVYSERNWHNCDEHMRSVRTLKYKLIRNAYTDLPHGTAADLSRSPSWRSLKDLKDAGKLAPEQSQIFQVPRPSHELYDVEADPWEFNNLAEDPDHAAVVKELESKLDQWTRETDDFPPTERRRHDDTDRFTGIKFMKSVPDLIE
jgi:arylsulfatase A-like enzyme